MTKELPRWDTDDLDSLKPFSCIRLIVVDLDGTVLRATQVQGPAMFSNLIRSLGSHRYDVDLTLATGRTLAGVLTLFQPKLPFRKDMPLILYNGSVIVRNGSFSVLQRRIIKSDAVKQIVALGLRYGYNVLAYAYGDPNGQPYSTVKAYERVLGWSTTDGPEREFNGVTVHWDNRPIIQDDFTPSAILVDTANNPSAVPVATTELNLIEGISLTRSSHRYVEIRPYNSDKGSALRYVAHQRGLLRHEILAIGDNDNDTEMLSWAGIGVAVAAASVRAVESSNYVAQYGVIDGTIQALQLVRSARRYFFDRDHN